MGKRLTKEERSKAMAAVKVRDTQPEMKVRRLLHSLGYRYSLHRKDLPGSPDIVFPRRKKVIFVHGCFWHSHSECPRGKRPTSNRIFWDKKLDKNIERDCEATDKLHRAGWHVLIVWECMTKNQEDLRQLLTKFLSS